jgi:hypothetical protein
MPCALIEPDGYPNYLKAILKEIEAGNDDELKACACSLRTPVTDEGCLITDEDGKLLAFPFCLTDSPPPPPYYTSRVATSIGLSYKDAMRLYWSKTINMKFTGYKSISTSPPNPNCPVCISTGSTSFNSDKLSNKDLVCGSSKGGAVDTKCYEGPCQPGYTIRGDGACCYGAGSSYFGVELSCFVSADSFKFPFPEIPDSRGWIDKEAQLIYPYIYSYMNMGLINGSPGNLILAASSGQSNGSKIILNVSNNGGSIEITPNI